MLADSDPPEVVNELRANFGGVRAWDIGANIGQSIDWLVKVFDKVVCFEPAVEALPELLDQAEIYRAKVEISRFAVTDHDGEVRLMEVPAKIRDRQLVTPGIRNMEWDEHDSDLRSVPGMTVDSLTQRHGVPDFMKIDVEGHEARVFLGAYMTLKTVKPSLLIEVHDEVIGANIKRDLLALGYTFVEVFHPHYNPSSSLHRNHYWLRARGAVGWLEDSSIC